MFNEIRPEGSTVSSEKKKAYAREYAAKKRAEKRAMGVATGKVLPKEVPVNRTVNKGGRPKSFVNKATEYGAFFNNFNDHCIDSGKGPATTAIEVLIFAIQPDSGLDIKERARIAEKLAAYESSRAPIISIEHVQNITKEEEFDADEALNNFMESLRKV